MPIVQTCCPYLFGGRGLGFLFCFVSLKCYYTDKYHYYLKNMQINKKVLAASVLTLSLGAVAFIATADHTWGGYHWARTTSEFTLKLGDNVSNTWDAYLGNTSSDWSASDVLNTTVVAGGTNNTK